MPMSLRFGLLMESVNSCIFLLQILSCLTNSSSVFPFESQIIICQSHSIGESQISRNLEIRKHE
jgi:hypothetical protein